jgi:hypothetical protein
MKNEQELNQRANSAKLTLTYANGEVKTYEVAGSIAGDLQTGCFEITSDTGAKFVFLPSLGRFTGKRKRRLEMLYNL